MHTSADRDGRYLISWLVALATKTQTRECQQRVLLLQRLKRAAPRHRHRHRRLSLRRSVSSSREHCRYVRC